MLSDGRETSRALDAAGRGETAVEILTRDAAESPAAAGALGIRLLVGRNAPFDPKAGISYLTSAAGRGDGEALAQMATLKAGGAWMPQNWTEAFDLLEQAALRGSARAQGQLLVLGDPVLAARARGGEDGPWTALRQSIDIRSWLSPAPRRVICEAPRIRAADKFVPVAVCDWVLARAKGRYQRSMMFDGQKSNVLDSRTCSDFKFDIVDADVVMQMVRERVAATTTIPAVGFEPPQIFHYALGEEIKAHYDALRLGNQGYGLNSAYKGDRIATFLLYLNDDYDGGELEFPLLKPRLLHKGKAGDGVYFAHVDPNGVPDRMSLHAALPITRNEKFILSQWIHDRPFTAAL
jgi:hypothetical protein